MARAPGATCGAATTRRRRPTPSTSNRPRGPGTIPLIRIALSGRAASQASSVAGSAGWVTSTWKTQWSSGAAAGIGSSPRDRGWASSEPSQRAGSLPCALSITGVWGASSDKRWCTRASSPASTRSHLLRSRRSAAATCRCTVSPLQRSRSRSSPCSASNNTTTPSRRKPAVPVHGTTRAGSATPESSTTTCSGGSGRARNCSKACANPSTRLQHTQPSVSSSVSPSRLATRAASTLTAPMSLTSTA
jgi:hypothetical protein